MKVSEYTNFPAKILLFGEYSIILGGQALSLPLDIFAARLSLPGNTNAPDSGAEGSNKALGEFLAYLQEHEQDVSFHFSLDLNRMSDDIGQGLFLESNIPSGYGAGSSGSLVASVFSAYVHENPLQAGIPGQEELNLLRRQLAFMESYFHGSSSGLDPLTCLLKTALKADGQKGISFPSLPLFPMEDSITVFLVDSGRAGTTRPLVEWFRQQLADNALDSELMIALNNQVINTLLSHNIDLFNHFLAQLSMFQLENMRPMVPERIRALWQAGLESDKWILKLCGSGGGGFLLGFTRNFELTERLFSDEGFLTMPLGGI